MHAYDITADHDHVQGEGEVMPMMQDMMKQLFAKDVMYPSMNEIRAKVRRHPHISSIHSYFIPSTDKRAHMMCCSTGRGWRHMPARSARRTCTTTACSTSI